MASKRWIPWNWFKKEEETDRSVPVHRKESTRQDATLGHPLDHFHQEVDRLFDRFFRGFGRAPFGHDGQLQTSLSDGILKPTVDVGASDKEYTITVEIPGVDEKDVQLELIDDTLTVRGEKMREKEEKDTDYYRVERSYGTFQRVLTLPEDTDRDDVEATFRDGVLTVTIPRKEIPKRNAKRIEVKKAA